MPLLFLAFAALFCSASVHPPVALLKVNMTTTAPKKGVIRLAVFDTAEGLKKEEPFSGKVVSIDPSGDFFDAELGDLPTSSFALAAYHDVNNNGKLDRNLFGVPTEPYAFSGLPASKWRAPLWNEVEVPAITQDQEIWLKLRYWKEM